MGSSFVLLSIWFLTHVPGRQATDGSTSTWVPASRVGDPHAIPVLTLGAVGIQATEPVDGRTLIVSLYPSLNSSAFQIKK